MPVLPQRRTPTSTTPGLRSDASRSESPPGCSGPLVGMIADSCRLTILLQPLPILAREKTLEELRKQGRQCWTSVWRRDCLPTTPPIVMAGEDRHFMCGCPLAFSPTYSSRDLTTCPE